MIVGLDVGLTGPSWNAARMALYSAFSDKVGFCAQYDITLSPEDWPAQELCNLVVADNAELLGRNTENSLQNLLRIDCNINPVGSPVSKGTVESKFATVNESIAWVPGAWKARALEHDARNDLDLRWDATLPLREFTQLLIEEVLFPNNAVAIPDLLTMEMIQAGVKPYRRDIYLLPEYGLYSSVFSVVLREAYTTRNPMRAPTWQHLHYVNSGELPACDGLEPAAHRSSGILFFGLEWNGQVDVRQSPAADVPAGYPAHPL